MTSLPAPPPDASTGAARIAVARAKSVRLTIILGLYAINAVFAPHAALSVPLTLPILIVCAIGLGRSADDNVGRGDVFWFCIFLFFGISPLQRIGTELVGRGELTTAFYSIEEYSIAFAIIVLFLVPVSFLRMDRPAAPRGTSVRLGPSPHLLFAGAVTCLVLYVIAIGGIDGLVASRMARGQMETSIVAPLFLGGLTVCCSALVAGAVSGDRVSWRSVLAAALLLATAANPFNISRFSLLAAWAPFALCLAKGRIKAAHFYGASAFALLIAFPILSVTTREGVASIATLSQLDFGTNFFYIPFIDLVDTTVHMVRYMTNRDLMYGAKLVAILLFFVPRFLWPEKPIVGGLDIGRELVLHDSAGTDNLSFFVASDLYMDFSFVGPIVGGIVFALIFRASVASGFGWVRGQDLFKYFLIGSLPILLRGPLGAVAALFVAQLLALWLLGLVRREAVDEPLAGRVGSVR